MAGRKTICAILMTLLGVASGCASMGNFSPLKPLERSLIYHPTAWPENFELPPEAPVEDTWFRSADGTQIHGLFAEHPQPRAVALFCHGNGGNVADRFGSLNLLNQRHQMSVLMFDYRGFGQSQGKPDEQGILDDARAARRWLADRAGVPESEIVIMGRSLGGAVAIDLAAKDGAKALVLASTFTSLPDVANHHFKLLPAKVMMTQRLDSISKIANYHGPLLQSHGDADQLIPYQQGRRLFDAAPGPKRFVTIPDGGHNSSQTAEYREALDELLDSLQ